MTARARAGWLSGAPGSASCMLDSAFNRSRETFDLTLRGLFWESVAVARNASGERPMPPRTVAVIDSGFDLSIDRLRAALHPASRVPSLPRRDLSHGTLVALLVNEVAPHARLLLLEARPGITLWSSDVADCVEEAARHGAEVINLSLEFGTDARRRRVPGIDTDLLFRPDAGPDALLEQVRLWRRLREPYEEPGCRRECEVCSAIGALPAATVVVAASGNTEVPACPACATPVLGTGFHRDVISEVDGRVVSGQTLPETSTNLIWEVSVPEPPGFRGTSFAAPLLAGLAALQDDPSEFAAMTRLPQAMTPVLQYADTLARTDTRDQAALTTWHRALIEFSAIVPVAHRHWDQSNVPPCSSCSLSMVEWYTSFTVLRLMQGDVDQALAMADLAVAIAPCSASVHANLGETHLRRAELWPQGSGRHRDALASASRAWREAARLAPDVALYREKLASTGVASRRKVVGQRWGPPRSTPDADSW